MKQSKKKEYKIKFPLLKHWYIARLNRRNWVLEREIQPKEGEIQLFYRYETQYYPTLLLAYEDAKDMLPATGESIEDLKKIIADLRLLNKEFEDFVTRLK